MADRRIYELATKSAALGANDYFAVDNGTEAESKKFPTSYFTDQLADMQNVYGAKNLNKYPYYSTSLTTKGLTFTDLGDGRIKINGTATGTVNYVLQEQAEDSLSLEADADYLGSIEVISGSGSKGSGSQYQFRYEKYHGHTSGGYKDIKFTSSYEEVSINTSNGNTNIGAYFSAYSGNTFTDLIIAPMIRKASIKDTTWVPYAKTNKELTDTFKNQVANKDDEYSPSKPYEVGDRCIYNNVLYKCITACSAAAWSVNQTNFEATTLAESVTELNSALMTLNPSSGTTTTRAVFGTNNSSGVYASSEIYLPDAAHKTITLSSVTIVGTTTQLSGATVSYAGTFGFTIAIGNSEVAGKTVNVSFTFS